MAVSKILLTFLFPAIFSPLAFAESSCSSQPGDPDVVCELREIKLRISHLETVLQESNRKSDRSSVHIREFEKLIEEISNKIEYLESVLHAARGESQRSEGRLTALEEQVRLLWDASRRNNFDIHVLESKAQDAEERLEAVTSKVQEMADIVSEQWIEIQRLEQALHMAEMRALKSRRELAFRKCTFLKFVDKLFNTIREAFEMLDLYIFGKSRTLSSIASEAMHHLKTVYREVQKYHHQLQGLIRREMTKFGYTGALANPEFIFFLASALIAFPILGAWMLLSSQFG